MRFSQSRIGLIVAALLFAFASAAPASAASLCTVSPAVTSDIGPYSPPSIQKGAVPSLVNRAGLKCQSSVIVLLGINYVKAKFQSQNGMKLNNGSNSIAYTASADPSATVAFTQNGTVDYMQNNLLNVLGLLSTSSADFPFYVKPSSATLPPVGVYTDKITVTWNWYLCQGLSITLVCLGTPDSGTGTSVIDVKLTVTARQMVVTTSTSTTWDGVNGTYYPKAIPGSRDRVSATITNPDIIPIDANTLSLALAIPPNARIALDGDKSLTSTFVRLADGSPPSNVTITYAAPGSTTDDVDFSSDGGATWTYVPIAGDTVSQGAVTHIRLKPRGAMAASSNFTVSYPVEIK